MANFVARKDEYATSTDRVRDLRRWKDDLYQRNMPKAEVADLVDHYFRRPAYAHLEGRNPVFMVAPSTTGRNKLPYYFAKRMQSELGGTVVTGWAAPLERQKAALKGGLGKMRNPARFAGIEDKLEAIPKDRPLVLVDDVVTTGETSDALRELLEPRNLQINTVASLGQSEMRKVSTRDIERMTRKLHGPNLKREIEAVLQGRLKHKANYIERAIHDDTRQEIRDYFRNEHRRLQGLGSVHEGATRSLRLGDPSDPELQPPWEIEAGDSGDREHQASPSAGHAASERSVLAQPNAIAADTSTADLIFQLEELQEMVRRGMDLQRAREYGLDLLGADKIQPASKVFINHELSQALQGDRAAKPMNEIVKFAQEMQSKAQPAAQRRRHIG